MHLYSFCSDLEDLRTLLGVGGGGGTLWDTDAHTEHVHRPAPQKSRAQRVHIQ